MSARLAAGWALVCTLFLGGGLARAEDPLVDAVVPRRPVAVIDLSDQERVGKLAKEILVELNNRDDLKQLNQPPLQTALIEVTVEKDASRLDDARKNKDRAENLISDYKFDDAASQATEGQGQLHYTTPTATVTALYAQLSFALGAAQLGRRDPKKAALEFRLAHAVDPAFKPDGIRYLPEVVQAYEEAILKPQPNGQIAVTGNGRLFLDGRDTTEVLHGTRQTFPVPTGVHVVWLVGPDRKPSGSRTPVVAVGEKIEITVEDALLDGTERVQRAKLALKTAPDPAARASAMQVLSNLLEVKDAVLLTYVNSKIIVQTWRDRAPGFSALREYTDKDKPVDVLAPLLPPKRVVIPPKQPDPPKYTPPVDTRAWYRKPRYQIVGGAGVAIVVGVVIYSLSSWNRTIGVNPDLSVDTSGRK